MSSRAAYMRQWRAANKERDKDYRRIYRAKHREQIRSYDRKHKKRTRSDRTRELNKISVEKYNSKPANRQKIKARYVFKNAIRAGKAKRQACEVCGNLATQAHHPNYSNPLVVRHLCSIHHGQQHQKITQ